ncbi:MAG: prenyltransferase/squalene oxidase repeat-containing protein [Candidatus Micrarchaeota archaeon]
MKTISSRIFFLLIAVAVADAHAFSSGSALQWLYSNNQNGSFGFAGGNTFALMGAGSLNGDAGFQNQVAAWIAADLNDGNSWSWAEADLPAAELWALQTTGFSSVINKGEITQKLLQMKGPNGGFKGLYECSANCSDPDWQNQAWEQVETSTDTALVLLALKNAGTLDEQTKNSAINFLNSLQNPDGSFKQSVSSQEVSLYSLGPDLVSTTSLALLALVENGGKDSEQAQKAGGFLKSKANGCFGDNGRFYGPSLSSIAFEKTNLGDFASAAARFAVLHQKQDGGFADALRSSQNSNALDTGAALLAAKNINESIEGTCAPLKANLSFNNPIYPGNTQTMTANAEGAIESVSFTVTSPSGVLTEVQAQQKQNGVFEASFSKTGETGNYTVIAAVKPKHGSELKKSGVFEVKSATQSTPTPTPTPTPSPTVQELRLVIDSPKVIQPAVSPTPNPTSVATLVVESEEENAVKESVPAVPKQKEELQQSAGSTTGLAVANPLPWFALSIDEKTIALNVHPVIFISLLALAIIFAVYKRWAP